jgi:hypothetical protein
MRRKVVEYACTQAFSLDDQIIEPFHKSTNTFILHHRYPDLIQVDLVPIELQQDPNRKFLTIPKRKDLCNAFQGLSISQKHPCIA